MPDSTHAFLYASEAAKALRCHPRTVVKLIERHLLVGLPRTRSRNSKIDQTGS